MGDNESQVFDEDYSEFLICKCVTVASTAMTAGMTRPCVAENAAVGGRRIRERKERVQMSQEIFIVVAEVVVLPNPPPLIESRDIIIVLHGTYRDGFLLYHQADIGTST